VCFLKGRGCTPLRAVGMMKHLCIAVVVSLIAIASSAKPQSTATQKEAPMTNHATGPFDVKMHPQDDKDVDGVTRLLLDKQYHGDLEGTAKGQMLTGGMSADKSGAYVAIEKFSGTLNGRSGTFVLHHTGVMTRGKPELTILVAPDSGTGQLVGISGKMTINIAADGKHSYDLEYTLPAAQ
jgi:Protein of unknown function (DUF3224)